MQQLSLLPVSSQQDVANSAAQQRSSASEHARFEDTLARARQGVERSAPPKNVNQSRAVDKSLDDVPRSQNVTTTKQHNQTVGSGEQGSVLPQMRQTLPQVESSAENATKTFGSLEIEGAEHTVALMAQLDAEDAAQSVIVANSNQLNSNGSGTPSAAFPSAQLSLSINGQPMAEQATRPSVAVGTDGARSSATSSLGQGDAGVSADLSAGKTAQVPEGVNAQASAKNTSVHGVSASLANGGLSTTLASPNAEASPIARESVVNASSGLGASGMSGVNGEPRFSSDASSTSAVGAGNTSSNTEMNELARKQLSQGPVLESKAAGSQASEQLDRLAKGMSSESELGLQTKSNAVAALKGAAEQVASHSAVGVNGNALSDGRVTAKSNGQPNEAMRESLSSNSYAGIGGSASNGLSESASALNSVASLQSAVASTVSEADQSFKVLTDASAAARAGDLGSAQLAESGEGLLAKIDISGVKASDGSAKELAQAKPYVSSLALPVEDSEWSNQLSQKLMWMNARNIQSAELHLNPADLGPIEVRIQVGPEQSSINFNTQNQNVRELLEANIHRLRDMLSDQQTGDTLSGDTSQQSFDQHGNNESDSSQANRLTGMGDSMADQSGSAEQDSSVQGMPKSEQLVDAFV